MILGTTAAISSSSAQDAQQQRAIAYVTNVRNTLKEVIAGAAGTGKQTEFLLKIPGLPVDSKMDLSNQINRLSFMRILDKRPLGDLSGQTSEESMAMIYREVLNGTEPKTPTDEDQVKVIRSEIRAIDDKLVVPAAEDEEPTKGVQLKFMKYSQRYQDAVTAYNKSIRDKQTGEGEKGTDENAKFSAMQIAESNLKNANMGNSTEYFDLVGKRDQLRFELDKLDPFVYRREIFNTWLEVQGPPPVPKTLYYPPLAQWEGDSGYVKISFSAETLRKHSGSSSSSASANGGFMMFKASGSGGNSHTFSDEQLNSLSMEMEIKQVVLDHIWMDATVFRSPNWKFKKDGPGTIEAEKQRISYGKPDENGLYQGRLPLLPVGLVIARNIKINVKMDKKTADEISKQISGGGGGSFLGFSFGASASHSSTDKTKFGDATEGGFEIKAPTIIGYICEVLPECPTP
ncbi:hypothetical protein [Luteolibacter soli]|uniref:Tle cognate immunity protein 4 C-terminal domain-containing protein n=1 Tax=Luteolibacter soli TaxID=3135280 RepID=A0ABU9B3Z2_9BACT